MVTELVRTETREWELGPYHPALPGPMRIKLTLDGEMIIAGSVETGFLHRGLEKAIEKHPWRAAVAYADHLDPEAAVFGELALCLAVEEIAGVHVPARAQHIRVVLSELTRISAHMLYLVKVARAAGAETFTHYVLRDRERLLDLFELLTGARFSLNFLRFGGVQADVTEGFIERVLETCELVRSRIREYNDLLSYNQAFLARTRGVAVINADQVREFGLTGILARAAGAAFDTRRAHPYSGYNQLDWSISEASGAGTAGDAHDRFMARLQEISQSLDLLAQVLERMAPGEHIVKRTGDPYAVPKGEALARVESSRGLLSCHVVSDGGDHPARVQFRPPSAAALEVFPHVVPGHRLEDLALILASLDLGIAEADR